VFHENYALIVDGMLAKDKVFEKFTAYFVEQYPVASGAMWAAFGRAGSQVSTNMFVESYHRFVSRKPLDFFFFRVLKKKFLNRLANRRLEVLINILVDEVAPYYEYVERTSVSS
jgi:hypothetical protein